MSNRILFWLFTLSVASFGQVLPNSAEPDARKHELAFQLGGFASLSRDAGSSALNLGPGIGLQVNYGRRLWQNRKTAVYGEMHFLASPLRETSSSIGSATRDVASLYATPGVRVKLLQFSKVSPYLFVGGGLAWYEQSNSSLNGQPNAAPREAVRGAFNFGGGADLKLWRFLALRSEIRDFYTGSPAYNLAAIRGGQHNVVAGAAFVIRWH